MRAPIILFFAFILSSFQAQAQVKFGVKAGISTIDLQPNELQLQNQNSLNDLGLSISRANYGFHFGIVTQIGLKKLYIQPEILFNSNSFDYQLSEIGENGLVETIKSESYQHLDIPILIGVKAGPIRLNAGPVGHYFLNSNSELTDVEGYKQVFDNLTYGWQAGLGVDIWKVMIDFRYEGNFSQFGEHINFQNQAYSFDDRPGRFLVSAGIKF